MRGIERRIEAGLDPEVASVASVFISRWDVAVDRRGARRSCSNRLGIAVGRRTYRAYRELLDSALAARCSNEGARRSVCSGPAPAPRTPPPPTPSTSRRSPRPSRSTRCPSRPCTPLPTTARSATRCRPTAAMPRRLAEFERGRDRRRRLAARSRTRARRLHQVLERAAGSIASKRGRSPSDARTRERRSAAALRHARPPGRRCSATTRRSRELHLRELFAADPAARRAPRSPKPPACTSTSPRTASPTRR